MTESDISGRPLYWQDWWLDTVAGPGNWERHELKDGGLLQASWVVYKKKKGPFSWIGMPPFTAYSGPWINPAAMRDLQHKRSLDCLEWLRALERQMGGADAVYQQLLPQPDLQLPLAWLGYTQAWRYTFRVDRRTDPAILLEEASGKVRTHIRKAATELTYTQTEDPARFLDFYKALGSESRQIPGDIKILEAILRETIARRSGMILEARDGKEICQGALAMVWDTDTSHYLCGLRNPDATQPDAMQGLIWEAIGHSLAAGRNFDFEGSVIPEIYAAFEGFGAELLAHPLIWKTRRRWMDYTARFLKKGIYTL